MIKKLVPAVLVVAGALLIQSASAQSLKVIKVATLSPLSGPQSSLGEALKLGAELALNEEKAAFKAMGFDLQLAPNDDQATPDVGAAAARRISSDKEILAVMGTLNSGVAIPASEILKDADVAMVSPANTNVRVTDRGLANMNRICARDDAQGPAGANFLMTNLKAKKVYVLNDKTAYGQGLSAEVEKTLKAKGIAIVGSEGTEEKANFQPLITKIRALNPDAIYFGGIYDQIGVFAKQLRQAGINIPVMGGDGLDSGELLRIAGDGAKNIYFTTVAAPASEFNTAKNMISRYKKAFDKDAEGFSVMAYDSMKVILKGVRTAMGNSKDVPSRKMVMDAIRKTNYNGLTGNIQFNSVGDRLKAKLFVVQVGNDLKTKVAGIVNVNAPKK